MGGKANYGTWIRYGFFLVHSLLAILTIICSPLISGSFILLCIHCCSAVAWLGYVPLALFFTARNSNNHFDHAGGEIAYVVISMATWIASIIVACLLRFTTYECTEDMNNINDVENVEQRCNMHFATVVMDAIQIGLLGLWLAWLIHLAYHCPGHSPAQAFQIPTHKLITGVEEKRDEEAAVDLYQERTSSPDVVRPFVHERESTGTTAGETSLPSPTTATHVTEPSPISPIGIYRDPNDPAPGYNDPYYTTPAIEEHRLQSITSRTHGTERSAAGTSTGDETRMTGTALTRSDSTRSQASLVMMLKHGFGDQGLRKDGSN